MKKVLLALFVASALFAGCAKKEEMPVAQPQAAPAADQAPVAAPTDAPAAQ